ncbi:MAG: lamin tail domain-containing protein, partial [Anaerolineae bacterium]|nr:lamin tail domain-containing protein [Anaerolineae bacterium]
MSRKRVGVALGIVWVCWMWLATGAAAASAPADPPPPRQFLPLVSLDWPFVGQDVRISAVYYDAYGSGEKDEAIQLWNVGRTPVPLAGWQLRDGLRAGTMPTLTLLPGQFLWCTREATAFTTEFGFFPNCEWGADTDPNVPDARGDVLRLSNSGTRVTLHSPDGHLVDAIAYEDAPSGPGWHGDPVEPYTAGGFGAEGQILYRKLDGRGQPVQDTDTASDWATDPTDCLTGRRVRYPGWDLEAFWPAYVITETAHLTVTIAPDNIFETVIAHIRAARKSIAFEGYVLESVPIGLALAERAQQGVDVRILLEGAPTGGITDA